MFIKNLIYNYNAHELLLIASRLVFALDACITLILIMELIVVLLLIDIAFSRKKIRDKKNLNPLFWVCKCYTSTCSTNNYDTIPRHSWNPPLNIDPPIIIIILASYNIIFSLSHPYRIDCKV